MRAGGTGYVGHGCPLCVEQLEERADQGMRVLGHGKPAAPVLAAMPVQATGHVRTTALHPAHRPAPSRPPNPRPRIRRAHSRSSASRRSEEHTSELQSLMRISYAVFCLKKKKTQRSEKPYKHQT